jgi:hypothetical protein
MRIQAKLCKAIGLPIRDLDPMDVYLAGGAIIQSQTLQKYIVADRDSEFPGMLRADARTDALFSGKVSQRDMATIVEEAYRAIPPSRHAF